MNGYGDMLARSIARAIIIAVVCAFALGVGLTLLLPELWRVIKPIIHGWTV